MIGKTTSEGVPSTQKMFADYLTKPTKNSMYLESIEPIQVLDIVQKLKPKTSFGHDEISTKMIKHTIQNIISLITHIINRSLDTGIVPQQLKIAKVIPIYKTSFSKILEKVMFNKIIAMVTTFFININKAFALTMQQFTLLFTY